MIPDYQTLMRPVLECAAMGEAKISDVVDLLAAKFALTDEERDLLLPSGKQTKFANRVNWAKSYLKQGRLYLCDRRSDMVISAGANIYPAEIEGALLQHPTFGRGVEVMMGAYQLMDLTPQGRDERGDAYRGRHDRLHQEERQVTGGHDVGDEGHPVGRQPEQIRQLCNDRDNPGDSRDGSGPFRPDRLQDRADSVAEATDDGGDPADDRHPGVVDQIRPSSVTALASSCSSATEASILPRLKSSISRPWTML